MNNQYNHTISNKSIYENYSPIKLNLIQRTAKNVISNSFRDLNDYSFTHSSKALPQPKIY